MNELNFKDIDLSSSCFEGLLNFFEAERLEKLGREAKFIERSTSRLSAWMFLPRTAEAVKYLSDKQW
jgi:hypothetical protein